MSVEFQRASGAAMRVHRPLNHRGMSNPCRTCLLLWKRRCSLDRIALYREGVGECFRMIQQPRASLIAQKLDGVLDEDCRAVGTCQRPLADRAV